jgi:toxin HigB-1
VISSFNDKRTAAVFQGKSLKGFPSNIADTVRRRLRMLDAAKALTDLRSPPGNCLEALRGNRAGQHSIRVNDQWRICFRWQEGSALDVEVVDYH